MKTFSIAIAIASASALLANTGLAQQIDYPQPALDGSATLVIESPVRQGTFGERFNGSKNTGPLLEPNQPRKIILQSVERNGDLPKINPQHYSLQQKTIVNKHIDQQNALATSAPIREFGDRKTPINWGKKQHEQTYVRGQAQSAEGLFQEGSVPKQLWVSEKHTALTPRYIKTTGNSKPARNLEAGSAVDLYSNPQLAQESEKTELQSSGPVLVQEHVEEAEVATIKLHQSTEENEFVVGDVLAGATDSNSKAATSESMQGNAVTAQRKSSRSLVNRKNAFLLFLPLLIAPIVFYLLNRLFNRSAEESELWQAEDSEQDAIFIDSSTELGSSETSHVAVVDESLDVVFEDGVEFAECETTGESRQEVPTVLRCEAPTLQLHTEETETESYQSNVETNYNHTVVEPVVVEPVRSEEWLHDNQQSTFEFAEGESFDALRDSEEQPSIANAGCEAANAERQVFANDPNQSTFEFASSERDELSSVETNVGNTIDSENPVIENPVVAKAEQLSSTPQLIQANEFAASASVAGDTVTAPTEPNTVDDLTKITGIGPATSRLLNDAGIWNFKQLAQSTQIGLEAIVSGGGPKFKLIDPTTWTTQAKFACRGDWSGLANWLEQQRQIRKANGQPRRAEQNNAVVAKQAAPVRTEREDDLTLIRGIGPTTKTLLNQKGITTFRQVAAMSGIQLVEMLHHADASFELKDPQTWPTQARDLLAMTETELERDVLDQIADLSQSAKQALKGSESKADQTTERQSQEAEA